VFLLHLKAYAPAKGLSGQAPAACIFRYACSGAPPAFEIEAIMYVLLLIFSFADFFYRKLRVPSQSDL
jgi:hypothetical protein